MIRSTIALLLAGNLALGMAMKSAHADRTPAQRLVRPDARAVPGVQRGLRQALEGRRPARTSPSAVARRLGQAGARGDRRARGRRGDAGAGLRHRRDRRQERAAAAGLADAPAAQQLALHLDDRVPGAQGQPEGHPGLGRSGQARRRGDHAQPEDLGRRALELPRGLGLCAAARPAATRRRRKRVRRASCSRTCRCSTPARAARRPPSSSAASATC